jgi:hypothetical protein
MTAALTVGHWVGQKDLPKVDMWVAHWVIWMAVEKAVHWDAW